jgi:hypothetical protein
MRHIHADHMIAAANDTSIEWQRMSNKDWANVGKSGSFTFFPDSQYRQKPAEPKMVDMWQWVYRSKKNSTVVITVAFFAMQTEAQNFVGGTQEILFRQEGSKITVPEVSQ